MTRAIAAWLLGLAAPLAAMPVFIGTFTGGTSASQGIYQADFDPATGQLTKPRVAADYANPGFLALHPSLPVLLAVGNPRQPFADKTDAVAAFTIGADQTLRFLGEATTGGHLACHLAVDATGRTVAVANYGDGSISTLRLDDHGIPEAIVSRVSNRGGGPNKSRQNGPHAHGVYFNPANTRLFVPDLGLDKVLVYPFDPATSKLGEPLPPLVTAPGAGPRHLAIAADGRHAYVINELDCTVLAAIYQDDRFQPAASTPLMLNPTSGDTAAEIELSHDGRFVYTSIRNDRSGVREGSLAVLQRNPQSGALTFLQRVVSGGATPRHFKLAPNGKWLLCANQGSNTISVRPVDPATGQLGDPACTVSTPSPVCLVFGR